MTQADAGQTIALSHGGWSAEVLPHVGGSLGRLTLSGVDVLRPTPRGASAPNQTACFPMTPYANRIGQARFTFASVEHLLPAHEGEAHSLHGLGWRRPWEVVGTEPDAVRLRHNHDGGPGWPWAYETTQEFTLDQDGLTIQMHLTNKGETLMPAGLGFHPYFIADEATRLQAVAGRTWLMADNLPGRPAPIDCRGDWARGEGFLGGPMLNDIYADWDGHAVIDQAALRIRLTAQGARAFQLYYPGRGYMCFEPVTHLPDAHNQPDHTLDVLAPGETLGLTMRINARRHAV